MTHEEMDYRTRHFEAEKGPIITFFECMIYGAILAVGVIYLATVLAK